MPKGHRTAHVRLDSAGYQADVCNDCEDTGKTFAIGGRLTAPTQQAIAEVPCDRQQPGRITAGPLIWYRQRGEVSEKRTKALKIGFGMERMPWGQFAANAVFFHIGVLAHNLFVLFKHSAFGDGWQRHQVATVRWRLFHLPGKLVRHAGAWVLKIARESLELFHSFRVRSFACATANPSPSFLTASRAVTKPAAARHGAVPFVPSGCSYAREISPAGLTTPERVRRGFAPS
ncbi:MAG: hypothetical protein E6Q43_00785 [Dokdonella sp.]|nr:MAG: hypothetical protein E6Q43_00785 [Dokdonella sp.]